MVVAVSSFKIAYMPVPKAACSSVKAALAMVNPEVDLTLDMMDADNALVHKVYPTMRFNPRVWGEYEGWWRFAVVRDPLKRLLSVYTDRVVARRELFNSPRLRRQSALPMDPDPDFFFQNLKSYVDHASVVKHHAMTARLFIGPKPLRFDRVFTVNQLGELAAELSERTGQPVEMPRHNSSGGKIDIADLQPDTRTALATVLAPEYDHLADYFDNPFK